ncbi:hypothetical protein BGZ83_008437 [Gryganskiella cystojenkinii]|nr:hypothetical protein BGZ83_008437 [Gryganskiella cystojenkinii]
MVVYPRLVGVLLRGRSNWKAVAETDLFVLQHHPRQTLRPYRIITRGFPHYCVAEGDLVEALQSELILLTQEARESIGGNTTKITSKRIVSWLKGLTDVVPPMQNRSEGTMSLPGENENEVEVDMMDLEDGIDGQELADEEEEEEEDFSDLDDIEIDSSVVAMPLVRYRLRDTPQQQQLGSSSLSSSQPRPTLPQHQRRQGIFEEDGYISDLSTLSNDERHHPHHRPPKYSRYNSTAREGKDVSHHRASLIIPTPTSSLANEDGTPERTKYHSYPFQGSGDPWIAVSPLWLESQENGPSLANNNNNNNHSSTSDEIVLPIPKAPRPRHRSIIDGQLKDELSLSNHLLQHLEQQEDQEDQRRQSDEQYDQLMRALSAPPDAPVSSSMSTSTPTSIDAAPPIPRETRPASFEHPPEIGANIGTGIALDPEPVYPAHTAEAIDDEAVPADRSGSADLTRGSRVNKMGKLKNPLRRRQSSQLLQDVGSGPVTAVIVTDTRTEEPAPPVPSTTQHTPTNSQDGVQESRSSTTSNDDPQLSNNNLRSILKRARSPPVALQSPFSTPALASNHATAVAPPVPPTRAMSSPLPTPSSNPSSPTVQRTPIGERPTSGTPQPTARPKTPYGTPSFISVPLSWFNHGSGGNNSSSNNAQNRLLSSKVNTTSTITSSARTIQSRRRAPSIISAKAASISSTNGNAAFGASLSRSVSMRNGRNHQQNAILDIPFQLIALLTYPDPEPGQNSLDDPRVALTIAQERNFVRQRRRTLMVLTLYIMLVRYSSFDFFLMLLIMSNCALLLVMKRSGQQLDVNVAKRAVSKRLGLARTWAAGVFRQGIGATGRTGRAESIHRGSGLGEFARQDKGTTMIDGNEIEAQVETVPGDYHYSRRGSRDSQQTSGSTNVISIAAAIQACHNNHADKNNVSNKTPPTHLYDISETPSSPSKLSPPTLLEDLHGFGPRFDTNTPRLLSSNPSTAAITASVKRRRFFGKAKSLSSTTLSMIPTATTPEMHELGISLATTATIT